MILDALAAILFFFANLVFALLPDWTPLDLSGFTSDLVGFFDGELGNGVAFFNNFVPVDQVLLALSLLASLWAAQFTYKAAVWLLTKLHVLGGSSE